MESCILELGSRSFRCIVATLGAGGQIVPVRSVSDDVALESGAAGGGFSRKAWTDAIRVAVSLVERVHATPAAALAIATPSLRTASNVGDSLRTFSRRTGIRTIELESELAARLVHAAALAEQNLNGSAIVAHLGDAALDIAFGEGSAVSALGSVPLGISRVHQAFGAAERGLELIDTSAVFSLVRLCAGPAARRLRERATGPLVVSSENVASVRRVARAWGYMESDARTIDRMALHALVPEILATDSVVLRRLGISGHRVFSVGTTAVMIDALCDLLSRREVQLSGYGIGEGAAFSDLVHRTAAPRLADPSLSVTAA